MFESVIVNKLLVYSNYFLELFSSTHLFQSHRFDVLLDLICVIVMNS
jgi:hypothetical protein